MNVSNIAQKKQSFKITVCFFIALELCEIILSLLFSSTPIGLLFPIILYVLLQHLKKNSLRLLDYQYLLLPFFSYGLLYIYLFFISPEPISNAIWARWYLTFYIIYVLIFIILIFVNNDDSVALELIDERLVIRQMNLLLSLHLGVVFALAYMRIQGETIGVIFNSDREWIMLLFLFSSILLKTYYLYKTNVKNEDLYRIPDIVENRCDEHRKTLAYLFENKKIYLIHNLDKEYLSNESGISRTDLNYFFEKYIEADFRIFVAGYRIRYALELLNSNKDAYTLEFIASQSGYRSLATFNKYFVLFTGLTPTQYINNMKSSEHMKEDTK